MSLQNKNDIHIKYMRMALALAQEGKGRTTPNPCVGCIIVKDGKIISSARSGDFGSPHAEISAINKAEKASLVGADLYVTLEPCSHHGVNPPCADAVVNSGIKRVFIANLDPNPLVNGGGIGKLKSSNIEVIEGILSDEVAEYNLPFFKRMMLQKPYVTLKLAVSMDGKISLSNGKSQWITGEQARQYAHMLRLKTDAIMVGVGTVLADNPMLDCRIEGLEEFSPAVFVIDPSLKISEESKIIQSSNSRKTYLFARESAKENLGKDKIGEAKIISAKVDNDKNICSHFILKNIAKLKYSSALIEGGSKTAGIFVRQGLVDEIQLIISPKILGGESISAISELNLSEIKDSGFKVYATKKLGEDTLIIYKKSVVF